jgi:hypothetical protein
MRAAAVGFMVLISAAACAGPALAGMTAGGSNDANANEADWETTDHSVATALATGRYDIRASYRADYKGTPITVYVLQSLTDRADVLECYSNDAYETPVKCMKPKSVR